MNANELADLIEAGYEDVEREELVTMLRQQQAELDALKERNRFLESFYNSVKAG